MAACGVAASGVAASGVAACGVAGCGGVTGDAARLAFLEWLARERRAAPLTVEAYGADLAGFLGFLSGHLGGEVALSHLSALRAQDLRAWLAHEAGAGAANATRAEGGGTGPYFDCHRV